MKRRFGEAALRSAIAGARTSPSRISIYFVSDLRDSDSEQDFLV
jgi:hypothetical protein